MSPEASAEKRPPKSLDSERVVSEFCAAWERRDIDELLGYFADDAVYHNIPLQPVKGHESIRAVFEIFVTPASEIGWEVLNIASHDDVVFTERIDRFVIDGKRVELPVSGIFEVRDGKIAAWRDYFDFQTWINQTAPTT